MRPLVTSAKPRATTIAKHAAWFARPLCRRWGGPARPAIPRAPVMPTPPLRVFGAMDACASSPVQLGDNKRDAMRTPFKLVGGCLLASVILGPPQVLAQPTGEKEAAEKSKPVAKPP